MQRINLFPSPGFSNNLWGTGNKTVANGELTVSPGGAANHCGITIDVPQDVGQLTFSVEVMGSGNVQIFDTDWKFITCTGDFRDLADWTVKTLRFTPPAGKRLMITFYYGNSAAIKARRPQLESTYTYDAAVMGGLPRFFTGDTMPKIQ